jgi:kynurenine formamidase
MADRELPTRDEMLAFLRERRNWGRWGEDDQRGAINLITAEKRVAAAQLVRSGRTVSLSRDVPVTPGPGNPNPAQHWLRWAQREGGGGGVVDYYGYVYHGYLMTHIDALCHVWHDDGLWNGRDPEGEITSNGVRWGGIEHWRDGIVTRGVLLDVPKHRGEPYVAQDNPVHGWELEEIAMAQGTAIEPGDALVVYSGREAWQAANPDWSGYGMTSPGLHASCLPFLRDRDVSILVWDLMDARPSGYDGFGLSVHYALTAYGVALVDNALLEPLARACDEEGRYEFMLTLAPLPVVGGTGSPLNPIALF